MKFIAAKTPGKVYEADEWFLVQMEFLCLKEIEKILKVILILVMMGFNKKKSRLHGSQVKVYGEIALL